MKTTKSKKTVTSATRSVACSDMAMPRGQEPRVARTKDRRGAEWEARERRLVEKLSELFVAIRELYERVCGRSYPDHNYAAPDLLLLKLVGDKAASLRAKLSEWVKPCFCRGKAKCLMCETRDLLRGGGAERRANKRARRTKNGTQGHSKV